MALESMRDLYADSSLERFNEDDGHNHPSSLPDMLGLGKSSLSSCKSAFFRTQHAGSATKVIALSSGCCLALKPMRDLYADSSLERFDEDDEHHYPSSLPEMLGLGKSSLSSCKSAFFRTSASR